MPGNVPTSKISPRFGPWLRTTRSQIPMNLEEFAKACGLNTGTIRDFELQRRMEGAFSAEVFVRISEGLGMDLGYVLHMAGFDIGADGINITKLNRVNEAVSAFQNQEEEMRAAITEAMFCLKHDAASQVREKALNGLGRGLAALDLVTTRMRTEGFIASAYSVPSESGGPRLWSADDEAFLRDNRTLSNEEIAERLGRTPEAVRNKRSKTKEVAA